MQEAESIRSIAIVGGKGTTIFVSLNDPLTNNSGLSERVGGELANGKSKQEFVIENNYQPKSAKLRKFYEKLLVVYLHKAFFYGPNRGLRSVVDIDFS